MSNLQIVLLASVAISAVFAQQIPHQLPTSCLADVPTAKRDEAAICVQNIAEENEIDILALKKCFDDAGCGKPHAKADAAVGAEIDDGGVDAEVDVVVEAEPTIRAKRQLGTADQVVTVEQLACVQLAQKTVLEACIVQSGIPLSPQPPTLAAPKFVEYAPLMKKAAACGVEECVNTGTV